MSDVYYSKNLGRYNLASNEKDWSVQVKLPDGAPAKWIGESWPEDEEPYIEDEPPSVVIEMIAERLESHWLSTSREEKRKTINWCRENYETLDAKWAEREIRMTQGQIERLNIKLKWLSSLLCESEAA